MPRDFCRLLGLGCPKQAFEKIVARLLFLDVDPRVGIDSQTTMDLHFTTLLLDDDLSLTISAINVTDEDPPRAYGDLMYDGYTHNPLGRLFKVGFKYGF